MQTNEKNTNKCKHMQTNKRWGATAVRHGGEDTWQEMATDKNRHGMYCTRRERGRGNGVREDEVNTRSKQKNIVQLPRRTIATILIQTNL